MNAYCSKCCPRRNNAHYDRLRYCLRVTNYVLVELGDVPRIIRRQDDDNDSGISSLLKRKVNPVNVSRADGVELIDHFIAKLDDISKVLDSVDTRQQPCHKGSNDNKPLPTLQEWEEKPNQATIIVDNNDGFFEKLNEMDRRIAEALKK